MKPILRWLPPTAPTVGLGLIVLLVLVNDVVSEWNIRRLVRNEDRVVDTQKVLTTLEEVLDTVTEAETAERGFLITNEAQYLGPYRSAVDRTWKTLDGLAEMLADDSIQQQRVGALRQRVEDRFEELRQAIAARKAGGFDAARQAVSTNHGRRLMIEMRRLVNEMKEKEEESLARRAAQSRRSAEVTTITGRVAAGLGVGLVLLAFSLYRRDLSHRERAEDATRRLAAIVECSDDAILSKTLEGYIVSWNAGAERIYGYRAEEVLNRPVTMLCPPERAWEVEENLRRVRRGLPLSHFETSRIRKDGRRIDISLSISPVKDATGRVIGASAIARDITERKTLQREVLEIAAREQRRIGQDLHDGIGQELTGLAMLAQRLAGILADKALPEAGAGAKIASGLDQALTHVRALSKGLVPVEVDAEGLMVALRELAARAGELNGIGCTFRCREPVAILDNQTPTHLYRMSQEALTNAIKHGRARHVVISLEAEGDLVTLKVRDDGVGFQEPSKDVAGTGLRIMRYRAELIGAKLTIEPAASQGTIVTCTLPATPGSVSSPAPLYVTSLPHSVDNRSV
jgi:PAS domain S-box-containing protein